MSAATAPSTSRETAPHLYRHQPTQVRALHFVLGTTTAAQLRDFGLTGENYQRLSVGVGANDPAELDIRWVIIMNADPAHGDAMVGDGDWIVEGYAGNLTRASDAAFRALYEPSEAAQ